MLIEAKLPVTRRDIIAAGVAADVIKRILFRDMLRTLANNDRELTLVVNFIGDSRKLDICFGVQQSGCCLDEQQWPLGNGHPTLFGVALIVEPNAKDVYWDDRCQQ